MRTPGPIGVEFGVKPKQNCFVQGRRRFGKVYLAEAGDEVGTPFTG